MSKLDRLMVEALLFKKDTPPTKKPKKQDVSVKQFVKILREIPELRQQLEKAMKDLEPPKKEEKGKLTLIQKYMLWTIAGFTIPPMYVAVMGQLFAAMKHNW